MKSKSRLSLKLNHPNTTTHKTEAMRRTDRKTEAQTRQQPHLRLKRLEMNKEWTRWKWNIYSPRTRRFFLSHKHAVEEPNLATYVDFPGLIILFLGSENSWRSESESSSGTSVPFRLDESFILNLRFVIPTFVKFHVFTKSKWQGSVENT